MTRSLPLLAILLFLLYGNLVHSVDTSRRGKTLIQSSTTPRLIAREVFSSFNQTTDSPEFDHHRKNTSTSTTKSNNPPPSVTTIIIIQSNGQTFHELGGGSSTTSSNSGNGVQDPNESSIEAQVTQDNAELKRLITISTVVGGVGVVMAIAGTVVYLRLRSKRRRRGIKTKRLDLSSDDHNEDLQPRTSSSSSSSSGNHTSHQPESSSPIPPTDSDHQPNFEAIEMSLIIPSAPPAPTILPAHLRERHQQTMLLQQQESSFSPPAPSAPSAKELEMNLPSSSSTDNPPSSSTYHHPVSTHCTPLSPQSSKNAIDPTSSSRTAPILHLKPPAGSNGSDSSNNSSSSSSSDRLHPPLTPDLPPPAYTPSAPPLFILPPSQRRRSADQLSLDRYKRYLG